MTQTIPDRFAPGSRAPVPSPSEASTRRDRGPQAPRPRGPQAPPRRDTQASPRRDTQAPFPRGPQAPGPHATPRRRVDPLGAYTDAEERGRELIAMVRGDGGMLVVDRDAVTLGDRRLVAHLAPDEPSENAAVVCAHYLADPNRGRCRRVVAEDLAAKAAPIRDDRDERGPDGRGEATAANELVSRGGVGARVFCLQPTPSGRSCQELRWRGRWGRQPSSERAPAAVRLRDVVGAVESYEPACGLTLAALARYREDERISVAILRCELERLRESPIVLNRALRQAVRAAVERGELTMSEIATRCGRVKRGVKGTPSGDTSWLARRLGMLPESGAVQATPWIHTEVLALIARDGLGISPREVEPG